MRTASSALGRFRVRLRRLFYGHRPAAIAFQAGLLTIDLAAIAYFVATTFVADAPWMRVLDLLLGVLLTLEFLGRMLAHRHPMRYIDNGAAVIDLVVIASLFISALGGNLGFLRVLRTVRLLRSYNVLGQLKKQFPVVRRNEEVIRAALNLAVFVFMISALVFVTQHGVNPKIEDFVDALYFTVATLSTTGFGDVTLLGSMSGELLSIAMMLVGITLFLRLAQAVFRPGGKVLYPCPQCGLQRHELDAVHCKACGHVLNIPNDPDR
ncbi:MAG: potassium channel family protein [Actinomycetes bacterium]|jgi:voltage-gated potassium channel